MCVPTSEDLRVTLTNGGITASGTPVALESFVDGDRSQVWEFHPLSAEIVNEQ